MKKVMIVEDEKVIRQGIKFLLEEVFTGYQVAWEAENGERALEIIHVDVPDIILSDIRMPKMDGLKFLSYLQDKLPEVPVIVISGYDDFAYVREAFKLGVKDYLLKPIKRSELASVLKKIEKEDITYAFREDPPVIRQIKELIEQHLEEDLSLKFISNTLNLHPNYISQTFKDYTKVNLSDYIVSRRMEKANRLLSQTNLKIYDVAYLSGYSNAKHFSSVFKKYFGKTPQQFKNEVL
ncbi:response regulator [Oceanobacillus luteolus]|uniref:response regulator transcription factor n=1 Tax=Oceanobacillus luteolus TaxID=1274358 RepID=UPI0020412006|nr:response regulator [Oceanobacillus luteolus]MCM3740592.1 response regulator [Oceanobacillus luteolus]